MAHDHQHEAHGHEHHGHEHYGHEHHGHEHHGHGDHGHGDHGDHQELADILDLDAEVLHEHLTEAMAWVHEHAGPAATVLDLGAGTGAGTFALARRFPEAQVTAVDVSPQMLEHIRRKAEAMGVPERIRTIEADLDTTPPGTLPTADLVWAANSLHHLADPVATLRGIRGVIRPGGRLVVLEMDAFPRFLPGDPIEERCHALVAEARAGDMPHLGADWAPLLRAAGFTVEATHRFEIDLRPPLPEAAVRYAQTTLRRLRQGLQDRLNPADLAALEVLAEDVPHRGDLAVQARRTAWSARP